MYQSNSRNGLACDVFDVFVTHAGLAHAVTNTDCWTQNGSVHGRASVTFKGGFVTNGRASMTFKGGFATVVFQ